MTSGPAALESTAAISGHIVDGHPQNIVSRFGERRSGVRFCRLKVAMPGSFPSTFSTTGFFRWKTFHIRRATKNLPSHRHGSTPFSGLLPGGTTASSAAHTVRGRGVPTVAVSDSLSGNGTGPWIVGSALVEAACSSDRAGCCPGGVFERQDLPNQV